ncbi:GtrA family protein [candidate division TM7 genomosp. GTL1]|nr:GtrA family protein [candidate division TM7 genomosp. GTL1]
MIKQFYSRQFMSFLLAGGIAAFVNIASRFLYSQWVSFSTAVILAYITGLITAFVLTKLFVFKSSTQALHRSAFFFVLVNVVAAAQTWLISMGLAYYILPAMGMGGRYAEDLSHIIGVIFPVFSSYIGHRRWSFR